MDHDAQQSHHGLTASQLDSLVAVHDLAPMGVWLMDRQLRILGVNRAMADIAGRPAAALTGRALDEVLPALAAGLETAVQQVLQEGEAGGFDCLLRAEGGEGRLLQVALQPLREDDGCVGRVLGFAQDVTDRAQVQAALRLLEADFARLLETTSDSVCVLDRDWRITFLNDHAQRDVGAGRDLRGQVLWDVFPEAVGTPFWHSYRRSMEERLPAVVEAVAPASDRTFLARSVPVADGGIIVFFRDVTEERAVQKTLAESEAAFRQLFHANPAPMWVYDRETLRFLEVNDAAVQIYGWSREAFLGMTILDIRPADERESVRRSAAEPRAAHKVSGPWRHMDASGRERRVDAVSYCMEFGGRPAVLVTAWDVTDRLRAEEALRESEQFSRGVIESTMDCVKVLDLEGRLLFMNGPGLSLLEIEDFNEVRGQAWPSLMPDPMAAEARRAVELARAGELCRFTGFCPTSAGMPKWWDVLVSPIRGGGGEVVRLLAISRDISERRAAEQRISYLAYHDPLTDLPNRRLFLMRLEEALGQLGTDGCLALHSIDIDQFKSVNDALGHPGGDALLRQVAERLRRCVRTGDVVARVAGDEFTVIQTAVQGAEDASALARRICGALSEVYEIGAQHVSAGGSIGIALAPRDGTTRDELLRSADIALYRAKADGGGTFRFFERVADGALRRKRELKAALRTALDRGELELHFQPLIELPGGEVSCFEGLLRWRHPCLGLISPAEFIPVAEESGLVVPIGEWALRAACREAARWPAPIGVAVNLSPLQFRAPGLLDAVARALSESGLAAERLELEITETVLLQDDEVNLATLRALRALGVRIALDDFGTGFSSLSYLLRFPFDKLKIDRSFIMGLPDREESKTIVRAVVGMGRGLGISVTAEGVETDGQLEALREMGCSNIQGYLVSRPVLAREVPAQIGRLRSVENLVA